MVACAVAEDRTRTKEKPGERAATGDLQRDASKASRIQQLAKAVGNDEIAKRIAQGNATRDQMLAFVTERLQGVKELQTRELALTNKEASFDWWRAAGDAGMKLPEPEPTRWHATARAYDEAVQALCRGDLRRGQELLQKAIEVEEQTTDEMTDLVDTTEAWRAEALDPGLFAALVAASPTAGAAAVPEAIRSLVAEITHVEQTVPDATNKLRRRDPWWTLDEDEDGEEPDGGGA